MWINVRRVVVPALRGAASSCAPTITGAGATWLAWARRHRAGDQRATGRNSLCAENRVSVLQSYKVPLDFFPHPLATRRPHRPETATLPPSSALLPTRL